MLLPLLLAASSAVSPCRPPAARPESGLPWLPRLTFAAEDDGFSLWLAWRWPIARPGAPSPPRLPRARPPRELDARVPAEIDALLHADEALAREESLRCR